MAAVKLQFQKRRLCGRRKHDLTGAGIQYVILLVKASGKRYGRTLCSGAADAEVNASVVTSLTCMSILDMAGETKGRDGEGARLAHKHSILGIEDEKIHGG